MAHAAQEIRLAHVGHARLLKRRFQLLLVLTLGGDQVVDGAVAHNDLVLVGRLVQLRHLKFDVLLPQRVRHDAIAMHHAPTVIERGHHNLTVGELQVRFAVGWHDSIFAIQTVQLIKPRLVRHHAVVIFRTVVGAVMLHHFDDVILQIGVVNGVVVLRQAFEHHFVFAVGLGVFNNNVILAIQLHQHNRKRQAHVRAGNGTKQGLHESAREDGGNVHQGATQASSRLVGASLDTSNDGKQKGRQRVKASQHNG